MPRKALLAILLIASLSIVAWPKPASAALLEFEAVLSGANEVPARVTPGFGLAHVTVNDITLAISWVVSFQDLTANANAGHIHQAPFGVNGPVVIPFVVPAATFGTFTGSSTIAPALLTAMIGGNTYVNIHTATYPGGEIRGQLASVPEPASLLLVGIGLICLAQLRLRRRRH